MREISRSRLITTLTRSVYTDYESQTERREVPSTSWIYDAVGRLLRGTYNRASVFGYLAVKVNGDYPYGRRNQ